MCAVCSARCCYVGSAPTLSGNGKYIFLVRVPSKATSSLLLGHSTAVHADAEKQHAVALSPEAPCRVERSTIFFGFLLPRPLEFLRYFCALPPSGPGLAVPSPASALTAAGQPWSKAKGPRRRRRRHRLRRNATSASPSGPWRRPAPPSYPPSSSTPSTSPRYAGDPVVASISSREENLVG